MRNITTEPAGKAAPVGEKSEQPTPNVKPPTEEVQLTQGFGEVADHPTADRAVTGAPVGPGFMKGSGICAHGANPSPCIHANSMLTVMYDPPGLQDLGRGEKVDVCV